MEKMLKFVNHECRDDDSTLRVKKFWKDFNILDSIGFVEQSWNEITSSTLNSCWSKLLPEFVIHYVSEPTYDQCVRSLLRLARQIGGDGFDDMTDSDLTEITRPAVGLSAEDIHEILNDPQVDEEHDDRPMEEPSLKLASISKIMNLVQDAISEAVTADPIMTRSLRFKYDCENALKSYEELYRDMSRRARQTAVTDFFKKM